MRQILLQAPSLSARVDWTVSGILLSGSQIGCRISSSQSLFGDLLFPARYPWVWVDETARGFLPSQGQSLRIRKALPEPNCREVESWEPKTYDRLLPREISQNLRAFSSHFSDDVFSKSRGARQWHRALHHPRHGPASCLPDH